MKDLNLIEGVFATSDAKKILFALIDSKLRYHNVKLVSNNKRFGIMDSNSEERIVYLKNAKKQLQEVIELAEAKNKKVAIHSSVRIELLD
jgi:hypothetical protein